MTWGAVAAAGATLVGGHLSKESAKKSARQAASVQAEGQREGLEYLKEREALPMFYRDQALGALAAEYGLTPYSQERSGGMGPFQVSQSP